MVTDVTDEDFARQLNDLCDCCHENTPNMGYDICEDCYQTRFLGRFKCIGCGDYVMNAYSCPTCNANIPPEDADYTVVIDWLESRKSKRRRSNLGDPIDKMLIRKAVENDTNGSCSICLQTFNISDDLATTPCLHAYHKDCLIPWLSESDTCPVCITKVL